MTSRANTIQAHTLRNADCTHRRILLHFNCNDVLASCGGNQNATPLSAVKPTIYSVSMPPLLCESAHKNQCEDPRTACRIFRKYFFKKSCSAAKTRGCPRDATACGCSLREAVSGRHWRNRPLFLTASACDIAGSLLDPFVVTGLALCKGSVV